MINYLANTESLLVAVSILLTLMVIILIIRNIQYRRLIHSSEAKHRAKNSLQEEALKVAEEQIKAAKETIEIFQKGFRVYNQKSKRLKIELGALLEKNSGLSKENKQLQKKHQELNEELEKMEKDMMSICSSADRIILKMMKEMYQKTVVIPENLEKIIQKERISTLNN